MTLTRCATTSVAHFGRTFWSQLFQQTFNFHPYMRLCEQVWLDSLARVQRTFNFPLMSFQGGGKARRILFVAFMLAHRILPVAFVLHGSLAPCVSALLKCTLRFSTAQMHRWGPAGVSSKQCYLHLQGGDKAVCIPFCVAARLACDQAADEFKPLLGFPPGPLPPPGQYSRRATGRESIVLYILPYACEGFWP